MPSAGRGRLARYQGLWEHTLSCRSELLLRVLTWANECFHPPTLDETKFWQWCGGWIHSLASLLLEKAGGAGLHVGV